MELNKKLAEISVQKIRALLEKRIAEILGCQPSDLPYMKLGVLVHLSFLLKGNSHEIGGFGATMEGVLKLAGYDLVWDDPEAGGYQLMRELTLDQMGKEISAAIQSLTLAQRKAIGELLLSELSEQEMGPTEFAAEVDRLKAEGRFPSLETITII